MQVQRAQNYNYTPQFKGVLKVQNLKRSGKTLEIKTSPELDKGLYENALANLFEGNWANSGYRNIAARKINQYITVLKQTLGIKIPSGNNTELVKLRRFDNGYSIKSNGQYKITHIREDYTLWE